MAEPTPEERAAVSTEAEARAAVCEAVNSAVGGPFPSNLHVCLDTYRDRIEERVRATEAARYRGLAQDRGYQAAQFQRETLRTSELSQMLDRAAHWFEYVDGPDSALSRAFAREIRELLSKPLNTLEQS